MELERLWVINSPKKSADAAREMSPDIRDALLLDTCQRRLWIGMGDAPVGVPVLRGVDAYRFILSFACGLESELVGEAEVLGQFKAAWSAYETADKDCSRELDPWIQRIFQDAKDIRSQFLQGLGSSSYGSLVRALKPKGPVLLIGAGQLGRSIAPWLRDSELWIWNRSEGNLNKIRDELTETRRSTDVMNFQFFQDEKELPRLLAAAALTVICIAGDAARESRWIGQATSSMLGPDGPTPHGAVIHLGASRSECAHWLGTQTAFHALDDIFAQLKSQAVFQSKRASRARQACDERAKLRALGSSLAIAHGWEDLAVFG